jgi:hypothetical protein
MDSQLVRLTVFAGLTVLLLIIIIKITSSKEMFDPLVGPAPTNNASQGSTGILPIGTTADANAADIAANALAATPATAFVSSSGSAPGSTPTTSTVGPLVATGSAPSLGAPVVSEATRATKTGIASMKPLPIKSYYKMAEDEKLQFIMNTYFNELDSGDDAEAEKKKHEDAFINSLPVNANCTDDYDDCPTWAGNGECVVNPEYMLYHCAKSCQSCALTPQQKFDLSVIYNSRPYTGACVYHGKGASYPGPDKYIQKEYSYLFK